MVIFLLVTLFTLSMSFYINIHAMLETQSMLFVVLIIDIASKDKIIFQQLHISVSCIHTKIILQIDNKKYVVIAFQGTSEGVS